MGNVRRQRTTMEVNVTLTDVKDIATITGVVIALIVYITNSFHHRRQSAIDNALRFIDVHRRLVETRFLAENFHEMERGTFQRDLNNEEMNKNFIVLLRALEQIALLQKAKAIPESVNTYMFGYISQQIQPLLTPNERNDIYWTLAVEFLDKMKSLADDFDKKTVNDRVKYFKELKFYT